mmetsp:Transcript_19307/g.26699  ORF Transcript_19307/g.26699 Transcript_19307/m.26699 type:complete len:304 (-) Transcript_19307:166-1077(-)
MLASANSKTMSTIYTKLSIQASSFHKAKIFERLCLLGRDSGIHFHTARRGLLTSIQRKQVSSLSIPDRGIHSLAARKQKKESDRKSRPGYGNVGVRSTGSQSVGDGSGDEKKVDVGEGVEVHVVGGEGPDASMLFKHTVCARVQASVEDVWRLWADLGRAPEWMRWISDVEVVEKGEGRVLSEEDPEPARLTRWMCSTGGFQVTWLAQCSTQHNRAARSRESDDLTKRVRQMDWVTLEGLQSQGHVEFRPGENGDTCILLQVSHSLPTQLGRLIGENALQGLVQATLKSDLTHFSELLMNDKK